MDRISLEGQMDRLSLEDECLQQSPASNHSARSRTRLSQKSPPIVEPQTEGQMDRISLEDECLQQSPQIRSQKIPPTMETKPEDSVMPGSPSSPNSPEQRFTEEEDRTLSVEKNGLRESPTNEQRLTEEKDRTPSVEKNGLVESPTNEQRLTE